MEIYTMNQWKHDGTFSADPGQEIETEIYFSMLNALPPRRAGKWAMNEGGNVCGIRPAEGFLMGEPITCNNAGNLFRLFLADHKGRTYYAGLFPEE